VVWQAYGCSECGYKRGIRQKGKTSHGKKWFVTATKLWTTNNFFVTATKLWTTNNFFVAATKNFAASTKRFVDRTKHSVVVTKYVCYPYFNK